MKDENPNELAPVQTSGVGEIGDDPARSRDAVFEETTEKGPNYRNVCRLSSLLDFPN